MNIYDFKINDIHQNPINFSNFAGKKMILVNTASQCGLTPQYEALEEMHRELGDQCVIIGFPCNDFGAQEPGSPDEIVQFCQKNYGVSFLLTEKIHVKGDQQHPIYRWLCDTMNTEVTWNFQKFLINSEGEVEHSIAPSISPNDTEILHWIQN
jgi:glutathione peroxidase